MAYVEGALLTLLTADADLMDSLAGDIHTNIIPPDSAHPSLLVEQIDWRQTLSKDGPGGPDYYRMQITTWAKTIKEAKDILVKARGVINGYDGTTDSLRLYIYKDSQEGLREDQPAEDGMHGEANDYIIRHQF